MSQEEWSRPQLPPPECYMDQYPYGLCPGLHCVHHTHHHGVRPHEHRFHLGDSARSSQTSSVTLGLSSLSL